MVHAGKRSLFCFMFFQNQGIIRCLPSKTQQQTFFFCMNISIKTNNGIFSVISVMVSLVYCCFIILQVDIIPVLPKPMSYISCKIIGLGIFLWQCPLLLYASSLKGRLYSFFLIPKWYLKFVSHSLT